MRGVRLVLGIAAVALVLGALFAIKLSTYASSFGSGVTLSEYDAPSITL